MIQNVPRLVPWKYVGCFLLLWDIVHHCSFGAEWGSGWKLPWPWFTRVSCMSWCWSVLQVAEQFPTKKFRSSREALTTLWLIRHSYRKRTTIFFSAGAPFTRRDRTCSYGPFGIWMHSCTSRKFTLLRKVGLGSVSQGFEMFLTQFP